MVALFERPANAVPLPDGVVPQLANWDKTASPGQQRLVAWLDHVDAIIAPAAAGPGPLAVGLTVGLPAGVPLDAGGRDLDNYLLPVVQRIGPRRVRAAFARKVRGRSAFAVAPARPAVDRRDAGYTLTMTGSSDSVAWKHALHDGLAATGVTVVAPGPLWLTVAITTGSGRVWTNLWKALIDSLGPILGEDPFRPFHPYDDRIVDLGLHHHVDSGLRHDVTVDMWWAPLPPA